MLDLSNLSMLIGGSAGRGAAHEVPRVATELGIARQSSRRASAPDATRKDRFRQVEERVERFGANVVAQESPRPSLQPRAVRHQSDQYSAERRASPGSLDERRATNAAIIMFAMV
jgi:hypothetical protein